MKKTYSVLATLATMALLSACANTQSSNADTSTASAPPPVVQESASAASASDANVFQGE